MPSINEKHLTQFPIAVLARKMANGSLTAEYLTSYCLERISEDDGELHAFIEVYPEQAIATAKALDKERAGGKVRGPLHGIPIAIKDLADVVGSVTTFGSQVYSHEPATTNALCVQRLIDAGMIIIGKTHMVEFALGSWGCNQSLGTPINPHDRNVQRVPGGSSSGSAVAVAAGMVPCAIGSDTGGSIRIPSSLCGIVGLKTTAGLIPKDGVAPLSQTLDTIGPMTNTVDDARLILEALADQPYTTTPVDGNTITAGILDPEQLAPLDDNVAAAFDDALNKLRANGVTIKTFTLPLSPPEFQNLNGAIMGYEGYANVGHLADDFTLPMDPFVRNRMRAGKTIAEATYRQGLTQREEHIANFAKQINAFDILLLPTTSMPATPIADADELIMPMSRFTRWGNYLNLCGMSLPIGVTLCDLPIGLQMLTKGNNEQGLINFAAFAADTLY